MIQQQIKIWILRLNGAILTEYIRKLVIKQQQPQNKQLAQQTSKNNKQKQPNKDNQIQNNFQKEEIVTQLIDNSRKLSLTQYENQLNYVKIKGISYYYRAKYNLLFVCASIGSQFTISAIQSILQNIIRLYEQKCSNICNGTKLPNILTHYQKQQLQKLQYKIKKIVDQQGYFQLVRMESLTDELIHEKNLQEVDSRINKLNLISTRQMKIRQQNVRFLHQTQKNVNKYKMKIVCFCFFALLTLTLLIYCFSAYDVSFGL